MGAKIFFVDEANFGRMLTHSIGYGAYSAGQMGGSSPNPPMDGARIGEGGEEVTDATVRARIRGRLEVGRRSVGAIGGADSGLRWLW